jgi:hypothetical protein
MPPGEGCPWVGDTTGTKKQRLWQNWRGKAGSRSVSFKQGVRTEVCVGGWAEAILFVYVFQAEYNRVVT